MLIWAGIAAMAFVGLFLVAFGLRGKRVDDHPVCRGCRFDLVGVWPKSQTCPECGADLADQARSVRTGNRQRRTPVFAVGVAILILSLAGGLVLGWGQTQSFNWNTIKPTWMLKRETESPGNQTAGAALSELTKRMTAGKLDQEDVDQLAERALEVQKDFDARWLSEWGDLVDAADAQGEISAEQRIAYVRQALVSGANMNMSMRETIVERDGPESLPIQFAIGNSRLGGSRQFWLLAELESLNVGGIDIPINGSSSFLNVRAVAASSSQSVRLVDLPSGLSELHAVWRLTAVDVPGGPPIVEWTTEFSKSIDVVRPEESGVVLAAGGVSVEQMKASVSIQRLAVTESEGSPRNANCTLLFSSPPASLAFEVLLRAGGREWSIGHVAMKAGGGGHSFALGGQIAGLEAKSVDVVFRASAAAAERTVDLYEIWDGEIVLEGVELVWPEE